jgi:nucleoside-diphosphate-sugar epimerase
VRVLVTGGTGFVGRAAVERLARAGHDVRVLARDARRAASAFHAVVTPPPEIVAGDALDRRVVERALVNCDALVQAAGMYSYERRDAKRMLVETPAVARSVLGAALAVGTPRVVDISSTAVFSLEGTRIDETTQLSRGGRPEWADPYVQAKVIAELAGRELELRGLPRVTLHPSLVIGPDDRGPGVSGQVVIRLLRGRLFVRSRLGWVDVREVAHAVVAALDARAGSAYIVSNQVESLSGMAHRLDRLTGRGRFRIFPPPPVILAGATLNERVGAPRRDVPPPGRLQVMMHVPPTIDGSRAERDLGIRYRPLDETLADAIRWWVAKGLLHPRTAGRLASATGSGTAASAARSA